MLKSFNHQVQVIEPGLFNTIPCPTYPEVQLSLWPYARLSRLLGEFRPEAIHIATEGTLGAAARKWCRRHRLPFTTSYHTQFPEYIRARAPIPIGLSYNLLRMFHGAAARTMVATHTVQKRLEGRGFRNIVRWTRGVDTELFKPRSKTFLNFPRPISIYVGRVAVEKNVEDFLQLQIPGTKVIVGDGPARMAMQAKYPDARFVGYKHGEELANYVAAADVFVFPSRTDTFGLVLLEAMACGVPVAAYPVTGPIDVVEQGVSGVLDDNLLSATQAAFALKPERCREHALRFTWETATLQFVDNLSPFSRTLAAAAYQ